MVGDSNEFVAARDGSIRHLANLAGAIAPICMHLQIAPKARAPRRRSSQPKATFSQGAKFFPKRRRTRGDGASAESIGEFVFEETAQYAPALSAGAFVRLNRAPQLPRETRFGRPGDRRAVKHRKSRSLRGKVAPRFRRYSAEDRCAFAIRRA